MINLIICKEHRDGIFDVLIQNLIETLIFEGEVCRFMRRICLEIFSRYLNVFSFLIEVMENSARKLIAKREYFSLLPLLPVLKYMKSVLPLFSQALQVNRKLYRYSLFLRKILEHIKCGPNFANIQMRHILDEECHSFYNTNMLYHVF